MCKLLEVLLHAATIEVALQVGPNTVSFCEFGVRGISNGLYNITIKRSMGTVVLSPQITDKQQFMAGKEYPFQMQLQGGVDPINSAMDSALLVSYPVGTSATSMKCCSLCQGVLGLRSTAQDEASQCYVRQFCGQLHP